MEEGPLALNPTRVLAAMMPAGGTPSKGDSAGGRPVSRQRPTSTDSQGRPKTGKSTGSAMELVDRLVDEMPIEHQKMVIVILATLLPADRRVFVMTLLEHVPQEDVRLKAFRVIEHLFEGEPDDDTKAAAAAPLITAFTDDPTEAVDIVQLHGLFPDHRWRELPQLPCPQRTALLLFFREMTNAEKKRVGRACGLLLPMICVLQLLEHPPDHRCTMCRVKAAHREQYLLEQNVRRRAGPRRGASTVTFQL